MDSLRRSILGHQSQGPGIGLDFLVNGYRNRLSMLLFSLDISMRKCLANELP